MQVTASPVLFVTVPYSGVFAGDRQPAQHGPLGTQPPLDVPLDALDDDPKQAVLESIDKVCVDENTPTIE